MSPSDPALSFQLGNAAPSKKSPTATREFWLLKTNLSPTVHFRNGLYRSWRDGKSSRSPANQASFVFDWKAMGLRPKNLLQMSRDRYPVHCGCGLRSSLSHVHAIIGVPGPALSSRQLLGQVRAGGDLICILGSKTCCGPSTRNHP